METYISQVLQVAKNQEVKIFHELGQPKPHIPLFFDEELSEQIRDDFAVEELTKFNKDRYFDIERTTEKTYKDLPYRQSPQLIVDGEVKTVIQAKQTEHEICGIDWLNLTMFDTTFDDAYSIRLASDGERQKALVKNISDMLQNILGFGIVKQNETGRNFYEASYQLEHNAGVVCIGGQGGTVLIMINGVGCDYAKAGWRQELYAFLKLQAKNPKITRVDLCHDDLSGNRSLAWFVREFDKGGFSNGNVRPKVEMRGNWKYPDGKGRTLYIGSRASPRMCRIYEKGKQLGDTTSEWVRTEVEFKAKGLHISLDVLLNPSPFFLMAYPCFRVFDKDNDFESERFARIEKDEMLTFARALAITKVQFGRYINCFRTEFQKHGLTDKDVLDVLTELENTAYPDKLDKLSIGRYFNNQKED